MGSAENIHTEALKKELKDTKENNEKLFVRATLTNTNRLKLMTAYFYLGSPSGSPNNATGTPKGKLGSSRASEKVRTQSWTT